MNHLGLALLIVTTLGICQMGAFFVSIMWTARRNHLPLLTDGMCGASWFAAGHVFAVIPFTVRTVQSGAMNVAFDEFFFATRLIFVAGILRMIEPCRVHWAIQKEIYYPTLVGIHASGITLALALANGKGYL